MNNLCSHQIHSAQRFAIYYAPEKGHGLSRFVKIWMWEDGIDDLPVIKGLSSTKVTDIIAPAKFYGFHGTLKPPFHLKTIDLEPALVSHLSLFARGESSFVIPRLRLEKIGQFIALTPSKKNNDINRLADQCVRTFDSYRQPESEAQMEKRRKKGLSCRQEELLNIWGYPYVFDEFRFHLTLTGPIQDESVMNTVYQELKQRLALCTGLSNLVVSSVCLFVQDSRTSPFKFHSRYPFKG